MTIHRRAGSVDSLLLETLRQLSPEAVETLTGKKVDAFYRACHPNSKGSLHFVDAPKLGAALENAGRADPFPQAYEDIKASLRGRQGPAIDLAKHLRLMAVGAGKLNKAVDEAFEDGHFDLHERRTVARLAQEIMDVCQAIRDHAEPPAEVVPVSQGAAE